METMCDKLDDSQHSFVKDCHERFWFISMEVCYRVLCRRIYKESAIFGINATHNGNHFIIIYHLLTAPCLQGLDTIFCGRFSKAKCPSWCQPSPISEEGDISP